MSKSIEVEISEKFRAPFPNPAPIVIGGKLIYTRSSQSSRRTEPTLHRGQKVVYIVHTHVYLPSLYIGKPTRLWHRKGNKSEIVGRNVWVWVQFINTIVENSKGYEIESQVLGLTGSGCRYRRRLAWRLVRRMGDIDSPVGLEGRGPEQFSGSRVVGYKEG